MALPAFSTRFVGAVSFLLWGTAPNCSSADINKHAHPAPRKRARHHGGGGAPADTGGGDGGTKKARTDGVQLATTAQLAKSRLGQSKKAAGTPGSNSKHEVLRPNENGTVVCENCTRAVVVPLSFDEPRRREDLVFGPCDAQHGFCRDCYGDSGTCPRCGEEGHMLEALERHFFYRSLPHDYVQPPDKWRPFQFTPAGRQELLRRWNDACKASDNRKHADRCPCCGKKLALGALLASRVAVAECEDGKKSPADPLVDRAVNIVPLCKPCSNTCRKTNVLDCMHTQAGAIPSDAAGVCERMFVLALNQYITFVVLVGRTRGFVSYSDHSTQLQALVHRILRPVHFVQTRHLYVLSDAHVEMLARLERVALVQLLRTGIRGK